MLTLTDPQRLFLQQLMETKSMTVMDYLIEDVFDETRGKKPESFPPAEWLALLDSIYEETKSLDCRYILILDALGRQEESKVLREFIARPRPSHEHLPPG